MNNEAKTAKRTVRVVQPNEPIKIESIQMDTPQQDKAWTENQKLEWIKNSSARLLKVFNTPD